MDFKAVVADGRTADANEGVDLDVDEAAAVAAATEDSISASCC